MLNVALERVVILADVIEASLLGVEPERQSIQVADVKPATVIVVYVEKI